MVIGRDKVTQKDSFRSLTKLRGSQLSINDLKDKFIQKTTILEGKVQELETTSVKEKHKCNKTKDKNKIETQTSGLKTQNVDDTAAHIKKN